MQYIKSYEKKRRKRRQDVQQPIMMAHKLTHLVETAGNGKAWPLKPDCKALIDDD